MPLAPLVRPPLGSQAAMSPQGNPGANAAAIAQVREAVRILQMALPNLPMGDPLHKEVTRAIGGLAKHAPAAEAAPGVQNSALLDLQRNAQQQQPLMALMRMAQMHAQQGQPGAPAPGGAPAAAAPPAA